MQTRKQHLTKIILIGFGTVGQGLAEILRDKADDLMQKHHFSAQIVGVATASRGILYNPNGLGIEKLLAAVLAPDADKPGTFANYPDETGLQRDWPDIETFIRTAQADVLIEASPSNFKDAQPALDYCRAALETGKHLILANKGPVALAYDELQQQAAQQGLHLRFEATVMAGTPVIAVGHEMLSGCKITKIQGILNGTTNFILTEMENGLSYEKALEKAQLLGYAESDPSADVEGRDAAGKLLILLGSLFGRSLSLDALTISGITAIRSEDIVAAQAAGKRYKLIAEASAEGGSVRLVQLEQNHPLANVSGATNAITFSTDLLGDVTVIGAGAGRHETGYALLADLLLLHRAVTTLP